MKKLAVLAILMAAAASAYAKEGGSVRSIVLPVVETSLADDEGKVVTVSNCSACHSLDYIATQPKLSPDAWAGTVEKMRKVYGADISGADAGAIASYLARNYGTGKKVAAAAEPPKDPAAGTPAMISGEASFRKYCNACHAGGGNIIRPGKSLHRKDLETNGVRTTDDIVRLIRNPGPGMPKYDGKSIPEAEARAIAAYVLDTFK
ncbi:MAG: c-type cytochrome [Thermodesulfobacteriota bacterium]